MDARTIEQINQGRRDKMDDKIYLYLAVILAIALVWAITKLIH